MDIEETILTDDFHRASKTNLLTMGYEINLQTITQVVLIIKHYFLYKKYQYIKYIYIDLRI